MISGQPSQAKNIHIWNKYLFEYIKKYINKTDLAINIAFVKTFNF